MTIHAAVREPVLQRQSRLGVIAALFVAGAIGVGFFVSYGFKYFIPANADAKLHGEHLPGCLST
jgi:hypothetical protein